MSEIDDLVEQLLTIEDSYHRKERRHKKGTLFYVPKKRNYFSESDKEKDLTIIVKLMKKPSTNTRGN